MCINVTNQWPLYIKKNKVVLIKVQTRTDITFIQSVMKFCLDEASITDMGNLCNVPTLAMQQAITARSPVTVSFPPKSTAS